MDSNAGNMYLFLDGQTIAGAADDEVMVLHLLGVVPAYQRSGTDSAHVSACFYYTRITNER